MLWLLSRFCFSFSEVWLWCCCFYFVLFCLVWFSLSLSPSCFTKFPESCMFMPFAEFGEFSSCYIFEFVFSPTLFLISSRTGDVNLSFLLLPHMVLFFIFPVYFFSVIILGNIYSSVFEFIDSFLCHPQWKVEPSEAFFFSHLLYFSFLSRFFDSF